MTILGKKYFWYKIILLNQADINCGTVGPAVLGQASVVKPKALDSEINEN